jgi:hypothetical protein
MSNPLPVQQPLAASGLNTNGMSNIVAVRLVPNNTSDHMSPMLDTPLLRLEQAFTSRNCSFAEFKDESTARYTKVKQQVDMMKTMI